MWSCLGGNLVITAPAVKGSQDPAPLTSGRAICVCIYIYIHTHTHVYACVCIYIYI